MAKRWQILPHEPERIEALGRALNVPPVLAHLLLVRGLAKPDVARRFLDPKLTGLHEPDQLSGAGEAADRLLEATRAGRPVVIYGDYDVDGVTGASILWRCLKLLGAEVSYYVPHRLEEGYGLNRGALEKLAREKGAATVVTVDCGITGVEEARACRDLGLELIITDHHEPAAALPEAAVLVHPRLPGGGYPFGHLSGAGVALKLAWALCQRQSQAKKVSPHMRHFLLDAVTLAAIGTIADVVPLVDENRILVHHGLRALPHRGGLGLRTLVETCGLTGKPSLDSSDVGFSLAPRLNAVGRLGQARLAVELLTTDCPDRARKLSDYVDPQNSMRQQVERRIAKQARHLIEQSGADPAELPALVLASREWHAGVIGIVASRLVDRYHRPAVLIALGDEIGQGSARSFGTLALHKALAACGEHLESYGGHAAAAGLTIRPDRVDAFREQFCTYVDENRGDADGESVLRIDAEVPVSSLTMRTVSMMDRLAPFGHGNPRPVLCATGMELAGRPKRIGGGERHLALRVCQNGVTFRAVAFGQGERADEIAAAREPFALAFAPKINTFGGYSRVELEVKDWRIGR